MISCRRCVNIRRRVSIRCFRNGPSPTTDCVQGDHEEAGHVGRHVRAQPREVQGARPHGLQEGRAYAFVLMCINTGTRNKEIRFTEVGDLDTRFWTFDIIHVKEEASCGLPRRIPTPRKSVRSSPTVSCYARNGWRTILWIHQRSSPRRAPMTGSCPQQPEGDQAHRRGGPGHQVRPPPVPQDVRPEVCGQGPRHRVRERPHGHASTKTTEGFYSRKRLDRAIENAIGTWNDNGGQ